MSSIGGPRIVKDGLVLYLDAGNLKSYQGSGDLFNDLSINNNDSLLTNGPLFDNNSIIFDGIDDYLTFPSEIGNGYNEITVEIILEPLSLTTNRDWKFIISSGDSISSSPERSVFTMGINEMYNNSNLPIQFTGLNLWFGINAGSLSNRVRAIVDNSIWNTYLTGCAISVDPVELELNKNIIITGVYDGSVTYLYINGELKSTSQSQPDGVDRSDTGGVLITDTSPKGISSVSEPSRNSNIKFYNLKIYNRALSSVEVLQNFNSIKDRFF